MRRTASIWATAAIASTLILLGVTPASAVEPPPPPVVPAQTLPSTYSKVVATGSGQLFQDQIAYNLWVRQQIAASRAAQTATTTTAATVAKSVPITQVAAFKGATAGSVLTGAFMGGWMITDGTLALYANATGTNPLTGTCQWGDFGVAAVQILYPFSSPDCAVPITDPNGALASGLMLSGVSFGHLFTAAGNNTLACWNGPATLPGGAGQKLYVKWSGGLVENITRSLNICNYPNLTQVAMWNKRAPGDTNQTVIEAWISPTQTGTRYETAQMVKPDPGRIPKCDLTWPDGSTTTKTGTAYHETGGLPLSLFNTLCNEGFVSKPGHGPELIPSEIKIGSTQEDTGAYTEISKQPVPDFSPTEEKGLTPGTAGGLVLQKVVGTLTSSCMNWDADCADWWTQTSNGTTEVTDTGTYRCLWNGSHVTLSECGIYRHTFDERTSTPTITDPQTGAESPWVSGQSNPTNSINPATGPGTSPGETCMESWPAAADPVSWVLHPVKCALVWAFVPRTSVVTAARTATENAWEGSTPGKLYTAVAAVGPALGALGNGNCGGLIVPVPIPGASGGLTIENHAILPACPGDFFADWAPGFFWFNTITLVFGGFFAVRRMLDRFVGNT